MRSFLRQLNQYSFAKRPNNVDSTDFCHPRFLRGRPDLLNQIRRRTPGEPAITANTLVAEISSDPDDDQGYTHDHPAAKACTKSGPSAISRKKSRKRAGSANKDNCTENGPTLYGKLKNTQKSAVAVDISPGPLCHGGSMNLYQSLPTHTTNKKHMVHRDTLPVVGVRSSGRVVHKSTKFRGAAAVVVYEDEHENVPEFFGKVIDSNSEFKFDEDASEANEVCDGKINAVSVEGMEDAIHEVDITTQRTGDSVVHVTSTLDGEVRNCSNFELTDLSSFDIGLNGDFVDSLFGRQIKDGNADGAEGLLIVNSNEKVPCCPSDSVASAMATAGAEYLPIFCEVTADGFESLPTLPPLHLYWAGATVSATAVNVQTADTVTPTLAN